MIRERDQLRKQIATKKRYDTCLNSVKTFAGGDILELEAMVREYAKTAECRPILCDTANGLFTQFI